MALLYVTGGDEEPNSILQYRAVSPKPELHPYAAKDAQVISVEQTPWGWRAELASSTENTPEIHTEIRVYKGDKKIELIEEIDKKPELKKEAVYFAFPFAMTHSSFAIVAGPSDEDVVCFGHRIPPRFRCPAYAFTVFSVNSVS